jgi:hypothetical protein
MNIQIGDLLEYKSKVVDNLSGVCIVLAKKPGTYTTLCDVEWITHNYLDPEQNNKSIMIYNNEFGTWKKLT